MRSILALLLSCGAGALSAQSPIPSASPSPAAALGKPGQPAAEVGQLNGFYGFDTDANGQLWAAAASYKVAFAAGGPTVLPFLGSTAPRSFPAAFSLRSVRIGGEPLALAAAASPRREGQRVTYDHRTVQQCYELRDSGVEQSFVFDRLPQRGAIEVTIDVVSELSPTAGSDGITFRGEFGGLHYGAAVAIDGQGKRCAVAEELRSGAIVLSVPAAFVATATLPLVIDPVISGFVTMHNNPRVVTSTDIVYLDNRSEYWTCFERTFSQTDTDVYVVRSNQTMGTVGAVITVDATLASWRHARMAGLDDQDRCLVVAEQSTGNVSPFAVVGRIVAGGATPAPLPAFDIQRVGTLGHSNFEGIHPDVGGDPGQASTTQWAVVWEKAYSATDHDICLRTVAADGTLGALFHTIDNSTGFEHDPVISKSNGSGWTSSKFWAIAYRRDAGNGLGETRVGIADALGAPQGTFLIGQPNTSPADGWAVSSPLRPNVSAPQPGGTYLLAETVVPPISQITEVWVTPFSPQGVVLAPAMRLSDPNRNCSHPRACSDTMRFAVAYQDTFSMGAPQDDDIRVATVAYQLGQLYVHENISVAESWEMESSPRITSRAEGGEVVTSPNMAVVWSHAMSNGTFSIEGRTYSATAPTGGIAVRPTGCGSLQVTASGSGAIGTSFGIQLVNPASLSGFVIGTPTTAAIPICPTCTQGVIGNTLLTSGYGFGIPFAPALVGATFAFQGFDFGMGPCLGMIRLTDTVDLTLR